jgi:hypothetical protein
MTRPLTLKTRTTDDRPIMTFETMLQWKESHGEIAPPFTADEKALALAVARAHYYAHTLQEDLPEQAGMTSDAGFAWWWGMSKVCQRRAQTPTEEVQP